MNEIHEKLNDFEERKKEGCLISLKRNSKSLKTVKNKNPLKLMKGFYEI